MAVTEFQRRIRRLITAHRLRSGESYVAGGAALATLTALPRISRGIDLFHDSERAIALTWEADRRLLEAVDSASGRHSHSCSINGRKR